MIGLNTVRYFVDVTNKKAVKPSVYCTVLFACMMVLPVTRLTGGEPASNHKIPAEPARKYTDVEDLAQDYLKALRTGKTTDFEKLYTHDSVIIENFSTLLGFNMEYNLLSDFTDVVKSGTKMGIDWNRVRFVNAEYITKKDGPFLLAHPLVVIFQHRLFRYRIYLNATKINGEWSLVPIEREKPIIRLSAAGN